MSFIKKKIFSKFLRATKRPLFYCSVLIKSLLMRFFKIEVEINRNSIEWAFLLSNLSKFNLGDDLFINSKKKKKINKKIVFLDIGANDGTYAPTFLDKFCKVNKLDLTLYALEPIRSNFKILEKNLENLKYITAYPFLLGASDQNQKTIIYHAHRAKWHSIPNNEFNKKACGIEEEIKLIKIDDFIKDKLLDNPSLIIKIDVEGYELNVLKGMQNILENQIPEAIIFETDLNKEYIQHSYFPEMHEYLDRYNYKCAMFSNQSTRRNWIEKGTFRMSEFDAIYVRGNKNTSIYSGAIDAHFKDKETSKSRL